MLTITLKKPKTGNLVGVDFVDGVGHTAKLGTHARAYFDAIGATVKASRKQEPAPAEPVKTADDEPAQSAEE